MSSRSVCATINSEMISFVLEPFVLVLVGFFYLLTKHNILAAWFLAFMLALFAPPPLCMLRFASPTPHRVFESGGRKRAEATGEKHEVGALKKTRAVPKTWEAWRPTQSRLRIQLEADGALRGEEEPAQKKISSNLRLTADSHNVLEEDGAIISPPHLDPGRVSPSPFPLRARASSSCCSLGNPSSNCNCV